MSNTVQPLTVRPTPTGFHLTGEIDSSTADTLATHLRSSGANSGDVELHMTNVDFIDSSGLRVLIEAHQEADNGGRRLVIVEPSAIVARLLDISGLTSYLHVKPSPE